jgi:hypothetical protein
MAETGAFDDLVLRLERVRQKLDALPPGQPATLTREELLALVEVVGRMARGFQVLERRGMK